MNSDDRDRTTGERGAAPSGTRTTTDPSRLAQMLKDIDLDKAAQAARRAADKAATATGQGVHAAWQWANRTYRKYQEKAQADAVALTEAQAIERANAITAIDTYLAHAQHIPERYKSAIDIPTQYRTLPLTALLRIVTREDFQDAVAKGISNRETSIHDEENRRRREILQQFSDFEKIYMYIPVSDRTSNESVPTNLAELTTEKLTEIANKYQLVRLIDIGRQEKAQADEKERLRQEEAQRQERKRQEESLNKLEAEKKLIDKKDRLISEYIEISKSIPQKWFVDDLINIYDDDKIIIDERVQELRNMDHDDLLSLVDRVDVLHSKSRMIAHFVETYERTQEECIENEDIEFLMNNFPRLNVWNGNKYGSNWPIYQEMINWDDDAIIFEIDKLDKLHQAITIRNRENMNNMKEKNIYDFYDNKLNMGSHVIDVEEYKHRPWFEMISRERPGIKIIIQRSLQSMSDKERGLLRIMNIVHFRGLLANDFWRDLRASIVMNGGACAWKYEGPEIIRYWWETTKEVLIGTNDIGSPIPNKEVMMDLAMEWINVIIKKNPESKTARDLKNMLYIGNRWLTRDTMGGTFYEKGGAGRLTLGELEDGSEIAFGGEGALVTIAPPGKGKSRCHVIPNLLQYPGPMVVLDVKGECWDTTSRWRAENIGPVYRFSPTEPERSAKYNPFDHVSTDSRKIWRDAKILADLMVVPDPRGKQHWDRRARDNLAAILAKHVLEGQRSIRKVMDAISANDDELSHLIVGLQQSDLDPLRRAGNSLSRLVGNPELMESNFETLRGHLGIWDDPGAVELTEKSDWFPLDLRREPYPTVYLCIPPGAIETYAPMLRVVIAQHIGALTDGKVPERVELPIVFMLDELPRLGSMEPVRTALEVGRQYGIKLWMFAQYEHQMEKAYPGVAEGMIDSCDVRIYMNASGEAAEKLSRRLGYREGVLDGKRYPLAETSDIAGPEFDNWQIAVGTGVLPARLRKRFVHDNPELVARIGEYKPNSH